MRGSSLDARGDHCAARAGAHHDQVIVERCHGVLAFWSTARACSSRRAAIIEEASPGGYALAMFSAKVARSSVAFMLGRARSGAQDICNLRVSAAAAGSYRVSELKHPRRNDHAPLQLAFSCCRRCRAAEPGGARVRNVCAGERSAHRRRNMHSGATAHVRHISGDHRDRRRHAYVPSARAAVVHRLRCRAACLQHARRARRTRPSRNSTAPSRPRRMRRDSSSSIRRVSRPVRFRTRTSTPGCCPAPNQMMWGSSRTLLDALEAQLCIDRTGCSRQACRTAA